MTRKTEMTGAEEKIKNNPRRDGAGCSNPSCCPPPTPYTRIAPKLSRNDPCPCGSGAKYKKCCGR